MSSVASVMATVVPGMITVVAAIATVTQILLPVILEWLSVLSYKYYR